ncbi:hypothetical protein HYR69_04370 [Candidatus Sumerlaeota bacterium]|nr:hypothetical protein [Candidatus Sumerlaeota bacterium]
MRRDFRRHSLAPQFDLFSKEILNPLAETADRLERDILKALRSEEFVLTDEGSVPSQYRKRVADYFESLSGAQRSP